MTRGTPPGLCADCAHARIQRNDRGSVFLRCALAETDRTYRKYPALPVLRCDGRRPVTAPGSP